MDEVVIDLKKYKKIYVKKTLLYLFLYPIIVGCILMILGIIIVKLGFKGGKNIAMLSILPFGSLFLNTIITWWAFYNGYKNTYKSTKFVIQEDSILFIRLKERNPMSGGTFSYHNIQSVSSYSITDEKIIVNGSITKRQVDERYPDNEYKERIIDKISVPNVFGNVQLLEKALNNKKKGVVSNGS